MHVPVTTSCHWSTPWTPWGMDSLWFNICTKDNRLWGTVSAPTVTVGKITLLNTHQGQEISSCTGYDPQAYSRQHDQEVHLHNVVRKPQVTWAHFTEHRDPADLLLHLLTTTSYLFPNKSQHKVLPPVTTSTSWHTTLGNMEGIPQWFLIHQRPQHYPCLQAQAACWLLKYDHTAVMFPLPDWKSQNRLDWKGPLKVTQSNPPAKSRDINSIMWFRAPPNFTLNVSKDRASALLWATCSTISPHTL